MKNLTNGDQWVSGRTIRIFSVTSAFAAVIIAGLVTMAPVSRADGGHRGDGNQGGNDSDENYKIHKGLAIAPVTLTFVGKDRDLVGLGSFIVNAQADCNGCHTMNPATEYTGNPMLFAPPSMTVHQVKQVNTATYLGGGQDFGAYPAPTSTLHIISRNLTPDYTGRAAGGRTLLEFKQIMKYGTDYDSATGVTNPVHPNCPTDAPNCLPYPFDGTLLQIMPWPTFQNMSDHDLEAIYEYLSAIPCIDTVVTGQPQLRNMCKK
jgi:hypothetical protein